MAKPVDGSAPLRWATAPLIPADVTAPDTDHKDHGWQDAEEPPHSFLNYWQKLVYLWIVYLHNLEAEALTWTAAHIFQAAVTFNGLVTFIGNQIVRGDVSWRSADGIDVYGSYDNAGSNPIFFFASARIDSLTVQDEFISNGGVNEFHGDVWIDTSVLTVGNASGPGSVSIASTGSDFGGTSLSDIDELNCASLITSSNASVGADLDVANELVVVGPSTLAAVTADAVTADSVATTADVNVGGDLDVGGNAVVSGNLAVATVGSTIVPEALSTPTLINSWVAGGGTSVRYYKNPFGEVSFKGAVTGGANNSIAFVLPVGYRPSQTVNHAIPGDGTRGASCTIDSAGNVYLNFDTGTSAPYLAYMDGVHFRV